MVDRALSDFGLITIDRWSGNKIQVLQLFIPTEFHQYPFIMFLPLSLEKRAVYWRWIAPILSWSGWQPNRHTAPRSRRCLCLFGAHVSVGIHVSLMHTPFHVTFSSVIEVNLWNWWIPLAYWCIGVSQYIDISQYTKNLYRIAIRNSYRNILQLFFILIKLFIFYSILVL